MNGYETGMAARGWLRVSKRKLDMEASTVWHPVYKHRGERKLKAGEIVGVEIAVLPSSTLFRKFEALVLVVQGTDVLDHPMLKYTCLVNKGVHHI